MTFDVDAAAARLVESRQSGRLMQVSGDGPPHESDAYAVQSAVVRRLGHVGGWKVGAKSPSDAPNFAPLLADLVRPSPAEWASTEFNMRGIEAEIAFRLGRDIPPRAEPVEVDEVYSAIASVHAAIEIVDTRLADWERSDPLWKLADSQNNGGLVYDPQGIIWKGQNFADEPVRLTINGTVRCDRRGGNPAGDPRWLLVKLANHCAREGGVKAGDLITTGSCTGMIFVDSGALVEAEFDGIGKVSVRFT